MAKRRLYLAYGSNLNLEQMAYRCPTAEVVGTATLEDGRLMFKGVATIERCRGSSVPVLVWNIQPQDEAALDIYEGWPHLYRKETRRIVLNGKTVNAMVYIMNGRRPYSPPNQGYYNTILEGYESAGFDTSILQKAALDSSEERKAVISPIIKEQIAAKQICSIQIGFRPSPTAKVTMSWQSLSRNSGVNMLDLL